MSDPDTQFGNGWNAYAKVQQVFTRRAQRAVNTFNECIRKSQEQYATAIAANPRAPWEFWEAWARYAVDFSERSVLLWDTLRKRGNDFIAHQRAG